MTTAVTLPYPRPDAADLESARHGIESLVCGMPGDPSQVGFEHAWEIRAFAMAVTAHKELRFDWSEFQAALISSIQDWERDQSDSSESSWSYYQHWVAALESVTARRGLLAKAELDKQTQDVLAQPPNRNHHEAHAEPIAIDPARPVPA